MEREKTNPLKKAVQFLRGKKKQHPEKLTNKIKTDRKICSIYMEPKSQKEKNEKEDLFCLLRRMTRV